jgi:DNA-binding HxlR family transcriptional regulator
MAQHAYEQYCGLARALDVAGDRWTLLIVRELVPGPRRFSDLVDGLPGISRPLLTERLRTLEQDGIVARRELPPPAARRVYELTERGRELAAAMAPLIVWGSRLLGKRAQTDSFRARWAAVGMIALADRDAPKGVRETYQYVIGGTPFYFAVDDGSIELHDGYADDPAVTLSTDEDTFAGIVSGKIKASAAGRRGALTVTGERSAVKRLGTIFSRSQLLAQVAEPLARVRS